MKSSCARLNLISAAAALPLLALCLLQAQAHAQEMSGPIFLSPPTALAPGQSLRFTLFNSNHSGSSDAETVRARTSLYDERGNVIAESDEAAIAPGESRSFDFSRFNIPLAGEESTGLLQCRAACTVRTGSSEGIINKLVAGLEVIEDGTSNTVFFSEVIGGSPDGVITNGSGGEGMMGLVPGQTLRFSAFNSNEADSADGQEPISMQLKIYDTHGLVIAVSREIEIPPGQFRTIKFNRDDLRIAGEPGTARAQVRIRPYFGFNPEQVSRVLASIQIEDNRAGGELSGHQCLVFFLGGTP